MRLFNPSSDHAVLSNVLLNQHHIQPLQKLVGIGSERWMIPGNHINGFTSVSITQHRLHYNVIILNESLTFDRIGLHVSTAGAGGTVARLGIYNSALNGSGEIAPDSLLLDAGTVSVATTGTKTIVINETIVAGTYFLVVSSDGIPTLRSMGSSGFTWPQMQSTIANINGAPQSILRVLLADGAAALTDPATAPTGELSDNNNFVALREA